MSSRRPCSVSHASVVLTMLFLVFITSSEAQLSPSFYSRTCPNALPTIRSVVRSAVQAERRMAASLIRLHFHDCFVQGCDASILLEDAPNISSERNVIQNKDSARGFNIIERAKSQVERICPGVVSCADILTLAAQYSSQAIAGPTWPVKLGRRDSRSAFPALATRDLPRFTDSLETLISLFGRKGLSARDMVALSGSHTIGQAQCATFRDRIYNNASSIDAGFARTRQRRCPANGGGRNLAPLDLVTPNSWDNNYFRNLIQRKGLLESDQVLFSGGSTDSIVREYIRNPATFNSDFASAMVKMADIELLTGSSGEIRRICSAIN